MKVSREQMAAHHERVLDTAARMFREREFDGIGVAEIMRRAGLTHGGFYGHFGSKEDLMAEACRRAVDTMLGDWARVAEMASDGNEFEAISRFYLSMRHRDEAGTGCLMAALGPEVSRKAPEIRGVVTQCLGKVIGFLARLTPGRTYAARRKKAIANFAAMVGALVIARAVNDETTSREVMKVVGDSVAAVNGKI